jgi:hypothetical protein
MQIQRFDIFELALDGPHEGNPFTEVSLTASFQHNNRILQIDGFYDGEGIYKIRLMPDETGEWRYETQSNVPQLDGIAGVFQCLPARAGNQGPVRTTGDHPPRFHFAYADSLGEPTGDRSPHLPSRYVPVGTTCYAWVHQGDALEEQTLATLAESPFNKLRMCVFPKDYTYNRNEPLLFPFERKPDGSWNFTRFHPPFWQHLERRVGQLAALGIEADLILFHPYDRWEFSNMGAENDDRYLRYIIARLAAYRNVWWSLANEYDLMPTKTLADWDRFFHILHEHDPHRHLCSIHNCHAFYDHSLPWVTHSSVQHWDTNQVKEWREKYRKPVVVDECGYEGDIQEAWGNFSPEEHVRKFWRGFCRGGYVGHGETYYNPEEILWWSKGGVLQGDSVARIAFLRQVVEAAPAGLEPTNDWFCIGARCGDEYFLLYLENHQPRRFTYDLPSGQFRAEILDTWEMTISPVEGVFEGRLEIEMPARSELAVRISKI